MIDNVLNFLNTLVISMLTKYFKFLALKYVLLLLVQLFKRFYRIKWDWICTRSLLIEGGLLFLRRPLHSMQ